MNASTEAAPATLVEVEGCPGLALLFADGPVAGIDLVPQVLLPAGAARSATNAVSALSGAGSVVAQASQATAGLQGLVRLTPETLKALQTATPLTNAAGANLGTLVNTSGKFAHSVQWVPAGTAGAVTVAASLGPAIALLMIQMQLASITRLVRENIELTDELLQTVRREQWASVDGLQGAMHKAIEEAGHVGLVTGHIWENVAGHEAELRASRALFRANVMNHAMALAARKDARGRADYLTHHAEAIVTDAQAMLRAQAAWFTYQAIRASRVHADPNEPDSLVEKIVTDARAEHDRELDAVDTLLRQLHRECSVLADLPGKRTIPFTKARRDAKNVARVSGALRNQVGALRESVRAQEPPVPQPAIVAFAGAPPEHLTKVVRWHLDDEDLLAIAGTKVKWSGRSWTHYLAVTDKRLLVLAKEDFERYGEINRSVSLDAVRYVRYQPEATRKKAQLTVVTPDDNLPYDLEIGDSAQESAARMLADLLGSHMNLPQSEIPDSPIVGPSLAVPPADGGSSTGVTARGTED
ncbi:hypothetical protein INN71_08780 [Nocardioides sp. ChNu-153]|uniref:hypothetical protein n=1 Tax=Nocardioides sp. ChNu-153 TaxID=2779364 RepID=UPI00264C34FC|nr:hypothetical protein [Nocardioides sp. ChNu-153]MDN7121483.1 hypothetical protein [Nocardioides sp. ChNu-153]